MSPEPGQGLCFGGACTGKSNTRCCNVLDCRRDRNRSRRRPVEVRCFLEMPLETAFLRWNNSIKSSEFQWRAEGDWPRKDGENSLLRVLRYSGPGPEDSGIPGQHGGSAATRASTWRWIRASWGVSSVISRGCEMPGWDWSMPGYQMDDPVARIKSVDLLRWFLGRWRPALRSAGLKRCSDRTAPRTNP